MNRTFEFSRDKAVLDSLREYAKQATVRLIATMGDATATGALVSVLEHAPQVIEDEMYSVLMRIDECLSAELDEEDPQTKFEGWYRGLADRGKQIKFILAMSQIANLGIKEAKDFVEAAPKPIMQRGSNEVAEVLKNKLEDAGTTVSLE